MTFAVYAEGLESRISAVLILSWESEIYPRAVEKSPPSAKPTKQNGLLRTTSVFAAC
jgi:hypothetical protein